ncbi:phosphoglycerate mutase family protein [Nocardia sp. NPDC051030]|uniref:phosphoglycerate mutase family protein n=1 Tax=Nocardia sp. NPDC051030 TaxID=3155162 RepID=UPI0034275D66
MTVLVVRHGLSEANNRANVGTAAFGAADAPLMVLGHQQARAVGVRLRDRYGLAPDIEVAVSTMLRTQQTARSAGFIRQTVHPALDEVRLTDLAETRRAIDAEELPEAARAAAARVLERPPAQRVWFTHGLLIAALCAALDLPSASRFIPRFCEIRELPL